MKTSLLLTPPVRSPPLPFSRFIHGLTTFPSTLPKVSHSTKPRFFRPPRSRRFVVLPPLAMASSTPQSSQVTAPDDVNDGSDAFQRIQAHQEAAARLSPVEEIRTILDHSVRGMLSTFSKEHEGYPAGSMVDFACDHDGSPILALSSLAVHSKNLMANPKCSLLVAKDPEDRTDTVITLYGDATPVSENDREAIRTAYLRRHPDAFWVDFGDFRYIQIQPKFVQYVSGVATALLGSGEFDAEEYKSAKVDPISQFSKPITSHMNRDHADDTKAIVQYSTSVKVDSAHMLDVDSLGFNVKAGYQGNTLKLRIPFPRRAQDRKDVKTLIVEMLQAAKSSSLTTE
ncbi:glutamyl-tRNA reductase-binding protein, chloroplastic [Elaeis guineensis]|uniref:Uncharacterized protein LOC105054843 n=1 Tax=Elaeis guineensis var. tenera TaxID=51953 RepID=A0A6I9RYT3_ELAGV|nr:uncharacterized protein LOC105054843 [Elaeis guineensis]XP_010934771.1 uncharacterized protein LOC105054843 [Elaeis guineensis]